MRLDLYNPGAPSRFVYDGVEVAAVIDSSGAVERRYVRGDGPDELIYQSVGPTAIPRWYHTDERGSVIAHSDETGNAVVINKYDEYGKPQATNAGFYQYTGQMWLGGLGLHYYKARMYAPHLGRFLQTDPIDVAGGINLYAYVGNDPVNLADTAGTKDCGLESNWRSGDCALDVIQYQLRQMGLQGGDVHFAAANIVSFFRGEISIVDLFTRFNERELSSMGALSTSGTSEDGYVCILTCEASRSLTPSEKAFYRLQGLPLSTVNSAVLHKGLPVGPYLRGDVSGYTLYNDVYLLQGIGSAFSSPQFTGLIGHELYHVFQYSLGATPAQFAYYQMLFGHDLSPLEVPAIQFGNKITACRMRGSC